MRASYESDGATMRQQNFFNHTRSLPKSFWNGTTNLIPVDHAITTALAFGYNHHIDRLMELGNVMLLSQVHPDEVYSWFMSMYVDAYDWVMIPNVYGMSQYSADNLMTTKPYISNSRYILKMSNYIKGEWCATWDALYWNFMHTHKKKLSSIGRMKMMMSHLEKMKKSTFQNKIKAIIKKAKSAGKVYYTAPKKKKVTKVKGKITKMPGLAIKIYPKAKKGDAVKRKMRKNVSNGIGVGH
jgi:deoxyribodipyrimidine photolyase-related protein